MKNIEGLCQWRSVWLSQQIIAISDNQWNTNRQSLCETKSALLVASNNYPFRCHLTGSHQKPGHRMLLVTMTWRYAHTTRSIALPLYCAFSQQGLINPTNLAHERCRPKLAVSSRPMAKTISSRPTTFEISQHLTKLWLRAEWHSFDS